MMLALLLACQPKDEDPQATAPVLGLSTTVVSFGDVSVGSQGDVAVLTLENWGSEELQLIDASVSANGSQDFFTLSLDTNTLGTGESVDLTLGFDPTTGGDHEGVLLLTTNDPSSATTEITLTGYGLCDLEPEVLFNSPVDGDTVPVGPTTLTATVSDQCDAPASLGTAWYAYTDADGSIYLGASTVGPDGSTSLLTDLIPSGDQVILTATVTNAVELTGQDSIEVTVE